MTIFALGFFDGVHLGHAALLRACRELAGPGQVGVATFANHPDTLVAGVTPPLINSIADRQWLLTRRFGVDRVVTLPFDRAMMAMPWRDFLDLLRREAGAGGFVCGEDFRFGCRGAGTGELLAGYCREAGLPWAVVPEFRLEGQRVSSTRIRGLLEQGEMEMAVRCLGHPHVLRGRVLHGKGLGRRLGVPTANLALPEGVVVPKLGVYATRARVEGREYLAVTNVGVRPTVGGSGVNAESWLPDFQGDLYGRELELEFYTFLRPERRFPDLEELQREIRENARQAREYFEKTTTG